MWEDLHHSQGGTLCPCSSLAQCALSLSTVLTGGEDGRITVLTLEKPTVLQVIGMSCIGYINWITQK